MRCLGALWRVGGLALVLAAWGCDDGGPSEGGDGGGAVLDGGAGGAGGAGAVGGEGGQGGEGGAGGVGGEGGAGGAPGPCEAPALCDPAANVDSQPPPLNEHSAVYDEASQTMIIFGGNTAVPDNCGFPAYTFLTTVWLYSDFLGEGCPHWIQLDDLDGPRGRVRHAAAVGGGAMWVFGGRFRAAASGNYSVYDDLWRFDLGTRTWQEIEGPGPSGRYNASLVYDSMREQLVLFGGNANPSGAQPTPLSDVWTFDIAAGTWTELETSGAGPGPRMWHSATYDVARDQMVVHGGGDDGSFAVGAYFGDLYALYPGSGVWEVLHRGGAGAPPDRFWGAITHDTATDTYLLFAGHDEGNTAEDLGNRNDTWRFDPEGLAWEKLSEEDVFNAPSTGFCAFPADFTIVADTTPERRNAHTMVWSETCQRALVFGGKTDCGAINDVWIWDAEGWTNTVEATAGEVCHRFRSNPDNCANLCF